MSSFAEVLARVMYTRLLGHLNGNNMLIEVQFVFRKNLTKKKHHPMNKLLILYMLLMTNCGGDFL
jgi:hypothetical protein